MEFFYLFIDQDGRGVAVHNCAEALDRVPYERIERRLGRKPIAKDKIMKALSKVGGEVIFADRTEQVPLATCV